MSKLSQPSGWRTLTLLAFVLAVWGAAGLFGQTGASSQPARGPFHAAHLSVDLLPLSAAIQPGASTEVGLHFVLEKGWHVYWSNAGDSGEPPRIEWKLPSGITVGPMQYPAPSRLPLGPLMDFGYENEVLFPMTLRAAPGLKAPAAEQLSAHVAWLVCREVCIPGKTDLALPLQIAGLSAAPNPATQALFARFLARLPHPLPPAAKAVFAATPSGFTLAVSGAPGIEPGSSPQFFPLDQSEINNPAPQTVRSIPHGVELLLKKDENLTGAPAQLNGVLRLGGTAYEVHAAPGTVPAGVAVATASSAAATGSGFLRFVLFAFAGGVVLNLMPCVFPVLFIKGLALVESSGEARGRLRAHGLAYTLGILVSFWAVVALLLTLRAGGQHLGWGFQFQSPDFIAVVALLLFFLGLSLAGMFEFGLTLTGKGSGLAARRGYTGSFFTGVLAMVVATPCTAPLMGAAVGFALAQPAMVAFAVFTSMALGLAAPYVLLTWNPAWTRLLPRPGAWMEILKQATAAPIFLTVIWLVWLFAQAAGVNALAGLLAGFLLLAIAAWILGRWPARRLASTAAAAVILAAVLVPVYAMRLFPPPALSGASASASDKADLNVWQPFSESTLEMYRAEGRPVFVDFTAGWCLSCQVNERVVLDRDDVRQRLHDSGMVLLRADWTRHDEEIGQALSRLGRSGIPTYVVYRPGEPAQILPEVLTPGIVFTALQGLPTPSKQATEALVRQP
ncbi:MAG TPA: protein-disulfide reductase DsbD domain-containing protein [Acidobacteriaceae bacterium]|nr:protein-disulfide reductase DsbD domain-containing protein [Acidobacteriaceae bacterium]